MKTSKYVDFLGNDGLLGSIKSKIFSDKANIDTQKTEIKENLEKQREDGIIQINGKDVEIGKDEISYVRKDGKVVVGKITKRNLNYKNGYWFKTNDGKHYTITKDKLENKNIEKKTVSTSIDENVEIKRTEIKENLEKQREDGIIQLNGQNIEIGKDEISYVRKNGQVVVGKITKRNLNYKDGYWFKANDGKHYTITKKTLELRGVRKLDNDLFAWENRFREGVEKTVDKFDKIKTQTISVAAMISFLFFGSPAGSNTTYKEYTTNSGKEIFDKKDIDQFAKYAYACKYDQELLKILNDGNQKKIERIYHETSLKEINFEQAKQLAYDKFGRGPATELLIKLSKNQAHMIKRVITLADREGQFVFGRKNPDQNRGQINRGTFQISAKPNKFVSLYNKRQAAGLNLLRENKISYDENLFKGIKSYKDSPGNSLEEKAQIDLLVRLGHVKERTNRKKRLNGINNEKDESNLFEKLASADLTDEQLADLLSVDIQGGVSEIGKKVVERLNKKIIADYVKTGKSRV